MWFWRFPAGFNQDEASIGYDAFADLVFGQDRNGYHNPVYSVAWGSGHSGLYIGLLKVFVGLLGLSVFSVRIVNVIFGCAGLLAFYGTLRWLRGGNLALLGLLVMAINPWHIMMSRWGLECNLFPNIFLIGLYFLVRGEEKPFIFYPVSLFFFGLSLYAYGTSYMFMPVFLIGAAVFLLCKKKITWKPLCISASVFLLTAVPIGIFMLVNFAGMDELSLGFISFPKLINGRYNTTVTVLGGSFLKTCLRNLWVFAKLILFQNDGLPWNSIIGFGTIYLFSLPVVLLGLFSVCREKNHPGGLIVYSMVPGVLVLAALSELNINRANIVYVLLLYLLAEGIYYIGKKAKKLFSPVLAVYFLAFCVFIGTYFTAYQKQIGGYFFEGFGEAVHLAAAETEGTVYLSNSVNAPYIYALFYEKIDPQVFLDTVVYENPESSVRQVVSFDRFVTGLPSEVNPE
ncbi:MAG: hypothetical protein ACI4QW_06060, partial [Clostridia bacterium]